MTGLEVVCFSGDTWGWQPWSYHLEYYPVPTREYRLAKKKPMVIVNGHTVPKWETEPLSDGDTYFLVDLPSDMGYARIKWTDSVSNQAHLENGTVFKNEADITYSLSMLNLLNIRSAFSLTENENCIVFAGSSKVT